MYTNVCKHCKRTFRSRVRSFCCQECKKQDIAQFDLIEEYLKHYPNSNAIQIAEELEMEVFVVLKFIEEGRLCLNKGSFSRLSD